jgi:hypothetical protein
MRAAPAERTRARGRIRSCAAAQIRPDPDERFVANPIASFVTPPTRMRSCPDLLDQG